MDPMTAVVLVLAGFAGAAINGVVGGGTLITFPVLLAAGAPAVLANGTNTLGMSVGSWSSAYAYRDELSGRRRVLVPAILGACLGAAAGAALVIALPDRVFETLVPWLILSATALVAVQPLVARRARQREQREGTPTRRSDDGAADERNHPRLLPPTVAAASVYGGYFGAGQGVVFMAVLGWLYDRSPQHANAAKNLFAATANITAAVVFVIAGRVWWLAAAAIALGAIGGGTLGARAARRLRPAALRAAVVIVGVVAAVFAWVNW